MKFETIIKDNGMSCIHAKKEGNGILSPKGTKQFKYHKQNMFLSEFKVNGLSERKFVLSIRVDGRDDQRGEVKLSQMNFNESELKELKIHLDRLLSMTNK